MKQKIMMLTLTLCLMLSLTACGGGTAYDNVVMENSSVSMGDKNFGFEDDFAVREDVVIEQKQQIETSKQKLVYTATLEVETKVYDDAEASLKQAISDLGGYIENTNCRAYSSFRNAYFKVRIPAENYREFLTTVCEIGSVNYQSERVEDITSSYLDVEARLKSLNEKMNRLLELQKEAENLDQLLKIEDQISDTQYQIENFTSQLKYMENKVSYCTVEINLNEVELYTEKTSFWGELWDANKESLENFVDFLKGVCLLIIHTYPYIILGSIAFVVVLRHKKITKGSKKTGNNSKSE